VPTEPSGRAALLAEATRGGIVEGSIRGHLVVVDGGGRLLRWLGEPQTVTTLRSAAKPFQGASFVESGTAAALSLGPESIAIACSSHHGEPGHVEAARRILAAAGLDDGALGCGAHLPVDPRAAAELLRSGGSPTALHNNCSGKHAAMLATCVQRGWPTATYLESAHPLQTEIAARLARHARLAVEQLPRGTDGCGLPTFALSLWDFAAALARAASSDPAVRSCQAAMADHPWLVGGTTSFDTALLRAAGTTLTAKGGAAAVFGAAARDGSWALAIKLESGAAMGLPQIASLALQQLGYLPTPLPAGLAQLVNAPLTNWVGLPVGEIQPRFQL